MSTTNYKPGDVVPSNGRWICRCGIGHFAHETRCVNRGCGLPREADGVQVMGPKTAMPLMNPFNAIMNRSLFKRAIQTGKLMVA